MELESLISLKELYYRKKKLLVDILFEVPIRDSTDKLYFLIEHKSRKAKDFEIQILKYKTTLHKWQKKEFGKMSSIIPILFYQGLDAWDPERELDEVRTLNNPILSSGHREILIFDLSKIDPLAEFTSPEMRAGLLLLKIIRDPWNEFLEGWSGIQEILSSMENSKRIELKEEMLDYIFRSRTEDNDFLEEAIMGKKVLTVYERAFRDGRLEGEITGELKKALETAKRMLDKGFIVSEIQELTGLSEDQLRENGIVL